MSPRPSAASFSYMSSSGCSEWTASSVDPSPVVEEVVDVVELRFRFGPAVVRHARAPLIRMTQRRRLDAFLLDAARERGVEVREGARVELDDASDTLSLA